MTSVYESLRKASFLPTTQELNNKSFTDKLIKRNEQLVHENEELRKLLKLQRGKYEELININKAALTLIENNIGNSAIELRVEAIKILKGGI